MGLTKTKIFSEEQNAIALFFHALAHPARIAILEILLEENTCFCGSLVEKIGLSQPSISQHLKELKSAGFISGSVEGKSVCYCIHPEALNQIKVWIDKFRNYSEVSNCC